MTLEPENTTIPDDDLNTTAPQSKPDVWKMPEPVFRKTSGKLPQGVLSEVGTDETSEDPVPPAQETPDPPSAVAPISPPVVAPKSSAVKMILVLLGLAAMTAFLIVFLTVFYFFFLRTE
jgi:hypothetical protein